MTYKERYLKEHPDEEDIDLVIEANCPEERMDVQAPKGCNMDCERCWNSEIPDGDDIVIDINPSGTMCEKVGSIPEEIVDKMCEVGTVNPITPSEVRKILDSGERRQFDTGAVRDIQEGKGRCDLMPLDVVGSTINNPTLSYIERFKRTGLEAYLVDALTASGVYHDVHTMFLELSKHFEEGAKKYGENNWQKGIPTHCYIDSAVRHYLKYLRGDKDEPHDRAFVWNLVCCIWTCIHKPELNDYKKKDGDSNG